MYAKSPYDQPKILWKKKTDDIDDDDDDHDDDK